MRVPTRLTARSTASSAAGDRHKNLSNVINHIKLIPQNRDNGRLAWISPELCILICISPGYNGQKIGPLESRRTSFIGKTE